MWLSACAGHLLARAYKAFFWTLAKVADGPNGVKASTAFIMIEAEGAPAPLVEGLAFVQKTQAPATFFSTKISLDPRSRAAPSFTGQTWGKAPPPLERNMYAT
jgi:hypothetical protein